MEAKIYEDALAVMQERGWGRRRFQHDDGRVCVMGAVCLGAGYEPYTTEWRDRHGEYRQFVAGVLRKNFDTPDGYDPATWNDAEGRTQAEVEDLLKYCEKEAAADE